MGNLFKLKDFVAFLSSIKGDLANITSPPFFLAPLSVTEIATCWVERPSLFVASAKEPDPQKRALLVLKWILCSLRTQYYIGHTPENGIKKPLNAFLGEVFMGNWDDQSATSHVVTEQVSHHPPITACYMWNEEYGIRGEGYTRVEMTFNGNVVIKQFGHAMVHLDKYDEHYLIPLPNAKVHGFWSGRLYPEINGKYHIISSSGFISEINFIGKGMFSGETNSFEAKVFQKSDPQKKPLYTLQGNWNDQFTIKDGITGMEIENCDVNHDKHTPVTMAPIEAQDAWETRRAWGETLAALKRGDMQATVNEKSKIEESQRAMRKREKAEGRVWTPLFFSQMTEKYELFDKLASVVGLNLDQAKTKGVWRPNELCIKKAQKPFHGELTPMG